MTFFKAIAATLLENATTVHYKLKVPITLENTSKLNVRENSPLAEVIRKTTLLVIDEVIMHL